MNNRRNEAKMERRQQRLDAGFVADHFPEVSSIVVDMTYNQKGAKPILRSLMFYPDSSAFFRVNCLNKECIDGGFDLTPIITSMIRSHRPASSGGLGCEGSDPAAMHSDISYKIAIKYL